MEAMEILRASPMPFGSSPFQDCILYSNELLGKDAVTNAFRQ